MNRPGASSSPPENPGKWICTALLLGVMFVYWPALKHDFVNYDDQDYVTENLVVQGGLTWEGIKWALTTNHAGNWHPLTWLTHMLDCEIYGMNMLAGPGVIAATAEAFQASAGLPLAERLIAAMAAGEAAGGDKRGRQSVCLRIHGDEDYPELDLRVDDHTDPIPELQRIYQVSLERFQPFVSCLAGRHSATGVIHRPDIEATIARFHAARAEARR